MQEPPCEIEVDAVFTICHQNGQYAPFIIDVMPQLIHADEYYTITQMLRISRKKTNSWRREYGALACVVVMALRHL